MVQRGPKQFFQERLDVARGLLECDALPVTYEDVALIACAVISACAAQRWPGKGIDKCRFLELLVKHTDPSFRTSWVSLPALLNEGIIDYSETPYRFRQSTSIFCSDDIDLEFDDAQKKYPDLNISELQSCCYASLIYGRRRCGYMHTYLSGEDITTVSASMRPAQVSYIGRGSEMRRMIHFHLDYIIRLAQHHVSILPAAAQPSPTTWWSKAGDV